ncbi:MAG: S8 family serine peptidase, partial [Candidatus Eisenbacteria bacterium]|nr:S8 family serine peptidase [Candidatus Eisenbacteria bacterium]
MRATVDDGLRTHSRGTTPPYALAWTTDYTAAIVIRGTPARNDALVIGTRMAAASSSPHPNPLQHARHPLTEGEPPGDTSLPSAIILSSPCSAVDPRSTFVGASSMITPWLHPRPTCARRSPMHRSALILAAAVLSWTLVCPPLVLAAPETDDPAHVAVSSDSAAESLPQAPTEPAAPVADRPNEAAPRAADPPAGLGSRLDALLHTESGRKFYERTSPELRDDLLRRLAATLEDEEAAPPIPSRPPTLGSAAAPRVPSYEIVLQSRRFAPEEGVAAELRDLRGGRHAIVQFWNAPPGGADWSVAGVRLLGYLPHHAYQAWVPAGAIDALGSSAVVRAVVPIEPADRISPHIRERGVSPYLQNPDGTVRLIVLGYEDVDRPALVALLEEYGTVTGVSRAKNMIMISMSADRVFDLAQEDPIAWIQEAPTENSIALDQARPAVGGNDVQAPPYELDGSGVVLAQWDAGWIDIDHDDFSGRLTICDTGSSTHYHATHVGGIMAGDGYLSGGVLRGIAINSDVLTYSWPDLELPNELDDETSDALSRGAMLSQNSWCIAVGAMYGNCSWHGDYDAWSQRYDEIVNGALGDEIVLVCASANEENDGDCPPYPWNQLSPPMATAKNSICVGAVYSDTWLHTCFSSRGPTDDGRLKPDLVAPGDEALDHPDSCLTYREIRSTYPGDDYEELAGTSMSAPMVSGAVGLLRQQFDDFGYGDIPPHTYKALLVQAAIDLGNPGPDYTYGHGMLDILGAAWLLERNHPNDELIRTDFVADDEIDDFYMTVPPGVSEMRICLAWDDVAGTPGAGRELVNDLDVYLIAPSGANYHAYTPDPDHPGNDAGTGWNTRDNCEVVDVMAPESGQWQVRVWGWDIPSGSEHYTLVLPYEDIQCGDQLYHSTVLGADLDCAGDGLQLSRSGICLDCAGHTISGDHSTGDEGIRIVNEEHVGIENCHVTNFETGIDVYSSDSCTIGNDNIITGNTTGIALGPGSDANEILVSQIYDNAQYGINVDFSHDNYIGGFSDLYNNHRSIVIGDGSTNNTIFWSYIHDNDFYGILMGGTGTAANHVIQNDIHNNNYGIRYWACGTQNDIEGATLENNDIGIYINETSYHTLTDNEVTGSTSYGVQLTSSTDNIRLEENVICSNAVDIRDDGNNSGDANQCAYTSIWADDGQAQGCDWQCSGCRQPEDDLVVDADLTLCAGSYEIPDPGGNGVISFGADGVALDGNGAELVGSGTGHGLFCERNDVRIGELSIQNYQYGVRLRNAERCTLQTMDVRNSVANGIFLSAAQDALIENCLSRGNGTYGFSLSSSHGNRFVDCTADSNSKGIYLASSTSNEFEGAELSANTYGIDLFDSQDNLFWDGLLADNDINAHEDASSTSNEWNAAVGNYWDDFPYNEGYPYAYVIPGPGDGVDWHPVGEVILVRPDGAGEYPTIQAAIDAAADAATIELTNGVFTGSGNRDLDCGGKRLMIRSAAGDPDSCIIDCQGTPSDPHRGFIFQSGETNETMLEGFTIRNGDQSNDNGGAILCQEASPLIRNCRFRDNTAEGGGAVFCVAASPTLEYCLLDGNQATVYGGALALREGAGPTLDHLTCVLNEAGNVGGAVFIGGGSSAQILSCTLFRNRAPQGSGLYVDENASHAELENVIVSFGQTGEAVWVLTGGSARLNCCDIYGNEGGDWVGYIASQYGVDGNIAADPLFCDATEYDFTIQDDSPCAPFSPPNPECDLIGAWPVGCSGFSAIEEPRAIPATLFLAPCRPNPLRAGARIEYGIPAQSGDAPVRLRVYDASGHLVRTLIDETQPPGYHSAVWNG